MFASLKVFFLFGRVISVIYEGKFYQMIVFRCFLIVFGWCKSGKSRIFYLIFIKENRGVPDFLVNLVVILIST
jgi:hypothetical protein